VSVCVDIDIEIDTVLSEFLIYIVESSFNFVIREVDALQYYFFAKFLCFV